MKHDTADAKRSKTDNKIRPLRASPPNTGSDPSLLMKCKEVCRILGDIHPRTLKRLEERGLIHPASGLLRHKLYARRDVEALVENQIKWNA